MVQTNVTTGHLITVSLKASEILDVTGTPSLELNDNEVATYLAGSVTNTLTFGYTVKAGDSTSDLQVTGLNTTGAAITDGAGNPISGPAPLPEWKARSGLWSDEGRMQRIVLMTEGIS